MNSVVNYIIEANLVLVFLYLMYWLLLRSETNFRFNRTYLLATVVLSLLFPLIEIGNQKNAVIPSLNDAISAYLLPEVVIGEEAIEASATETNTVATWSIVTWTYLSGILCLYTLLIFQLGRLYTIIKRASAITTYGRYKIVETPRTVPTFSFFHYIIIGTTQSLSERDRNYIIQHEIVHAQKLHSVDLILIELVRILFWFNPAVHLLKKSISDIHEFQADEKVLKDVDAQTYCSLLARMTLQSAGFSLANHFNKSLTLKRITMMRTMKRKMKHWKLAVIIPAAASLFIAIACQEQVMDDISRVVENSSASLAIPPDIQAKYDELQKSKPDSKFLVMELNEEGKQKLDEMEKKYGLPKSVSVFTIGEEHYEKTGEPSVTGEAKEIIIRPTERKDDRQSFAIIEYDEQVEAIAQKTADGDVFTIVEENAKPADGMEAFYAFIGSNMKYPKEAKEKGISGRVFVEFIVEKDGRLSELKVLKGIGQGCDEEALRVLAMSPSWTPATQRGKTVRQKLVLPVRFNTSSGAEEARAINKKMNVKVESVEVIDGKSHVTGFVTDENGKALADTNIVIKDTTHGTVTDQGGKFNITLSEKGHELVFSHIGFDTTIEKF